MRDLSTLGVVNPYALAELIVGHPIRWADIPDQRQRVAEIIGLPAQRLFSLRADSPLYRGLRLRPDGTIERLPAGQVRDDLLRRLKAAQPRPAAVAATVGAAEQPEVIIPSVFWPSLPNTPLSRPQSRALSAAAPDESPAVDWLDLGAFYGRYREAEEEDAIQGNLGDCYLIAAMSAVAWSRPNLIRHRFQRRPLATDVDTPALRRNIPNIDYDTVPFFADGRDSITITVSEQTPVLAEDHQVVIYARSADAGEIWPAVYEKAYARWKTGNRSDRPDYEEIAGGDCVFASAELTGLSRRDYFWHEDHDADEVFGLIREHSRGGRTFRPLTAWTYATEEDAPSGVSYEGFNIVANHCYAILGWLRHEDKDYVILRNPWGTGEATRSVAPRSAWETRLPPVRASSYSRDNGIFAFRDVFFHRYFEGFGVAS